MAEISEEEKQIAYNHFLNKATDKKDIEEKFKKLPFSEFTKYGAEELKLGCPRGWKPGPGGGCVPDTL